MIEGTRMVLQRRMQIGLREMTGVTGFGEQRQIGQTKLGNQCPVGIKSRLMGCGQRPGQGKNAEHTAGEQSNN